MADFFGHAISCIDEDVSIGVKTKIRHCCQVQRGARIGTGCSPVCEGVELEDDVFCGPSCVFTNDLTPRSKYPKGSDNYIVTLVRHGATAGADAMAAQQSH